MAEVLRNTSLSRRLFVLGSLAVLGGAFTAEATRQRERGKLSDFYGFDALPDDEFNQLVLSHQEHPVRILEEERTNDTLYSCKFQVSEKTNLYITAFGQQTNPVFVQPLIARVDDGFPFLLPLVHSVDPLLPSQIQIPEISGDDQHTLVITESEATRFPNTAQPTFILTRPDPSSLLGKFFDHAGIALLKDGKNVLDDIPLFSAMKIYKKEMQYLTKQFNCDSGENGGTMPPDLFAQYNRTLDVEWMLKQIFSLFGKLEDGMRLYQGKGMKIVFLQIREELSAIILYFVLQQQIIFFDHELSLRENVSLGLGLEELIADRVLYLPKPFLLPGGAWPTESYIIANFAAKYPYLRYWGLFEVALEGCLQGDDPYGKVVLADLEKIRGYILGEFSNRGCKNDRVELSRDPLLH